MSGLVGNSEDRFSHKEAHIKVGGDLILHGRVNLINTCTLC